MNREMDNKRTNGGVSNMQAQIRQAIKRFSKLIRITS